MSRRPLCLQGLFQILTQCGKMLVLDRLLVKFFYSGHRVLLFSTMTKFLDLMEARHS